MSITAMKQALEALEEINKLSIGEEAICLPAEIDTAMDALHQAIEQAEKQDGDQVIRSIKQEAETGLVVGDKVGMRDALQQILREADKHLGIEV